MYQVVIFPGTDEETPIAYVRNFEHALCIAARQSFPADVLKRDTTGNYTTEY